MNRNLNRRIHPIAEANGLSPKFHRNIDNKDMHFVLIRHCSKCIPDIPIDIKIIQKGAHNATKTISIHKMIPYDIRGQFTVNHNLMED